MEKKSTLISGKLTGTRTLLSDLKEIENPDEVEIFLKNFLEMKLQIEKQNNIIHVATEGEVKDAMAELGEDEAVSLLVDSALDKLFVTTKDATTYEIDIKEENILAMSSFFSSEKIVKYILNGFSFVKWCNSIGIELKDLFDILVYLKLLTNDVNPQMTVQDYMKKYTNMEEEELASKISAGNFVLTFGEYLAEITKKFQLSFVNKMINENSYFEGRRKEENDEGLCRLKFSYIDLDKMLEEIKEEYIKKYQKKAYFKSPLGRIATKFGHKELELVEELFRDDIEMKILNELFNNNMKVSFWDDNLYEVTCKYKNFGSVVGLVTAILKDTFYTLFERKIDVKVEGIVRE